MESAPASPKSQRFFIALVPPPSIQTEANAVRQEFAERFDSHKAFNSPPHITLQPPFHWPLSAVDDLAAAVTEFSRGFPAFPIQLQGFGAFPPRVIYIDVCKSPALDQLKTGLTQHLAVRLGLQDRDPHRTFHPHMTVAFRDLSRSAFQQAWPEFQQRPYGATFMADHLTLLIYRQRWEIHRTFTLGPEGAS